MKRDRDIIIIIVVVSFTRAPPNWGRETGSLALHRGDKDESRRPLPFDDLNAFLLGFFSLLFVCSLPFAIETSTRGFHVRLSSAAFGSSRQRSARAAFLLIAVVFAHSVRTCTLPHTHTRTNARTHARNANRHRLYRQSTNRRARGEAPL